MADPLVDIAVVALTVALVAVTILEVGYLRSRRARRGPRDDLLPDRAYNALVTTRSIAENLAAQGIGSPAAEELMAEAAAAHERGNHRVALEALERARGILLQEKRRRGAGAPPSGAAPGAEGPEEGPRVAGDQHLQARFALESGRRALAARGEGAPAEARELLDAADRAFAAGDYPGALRTAQRARRALGMEERLGPSPPARGPGTCARCGKPSPPGTPLCQACEAEILGAGG